MPHDGFNKTLNAQGKSTADIITAQGWEVRPKDETVATSVEEGIRQARIVFSRVYFDAGGTNGDRAPETAVPGFYHTAYSHRLVEVLKRYRRHINRQSGGAGGPVHDQFSHGSDMFRYLCLNSEAMRNDSKYGALPKLQLPRINQARSWMTA